MSRRNARRARLHHPVARLLVVLALLLQCLSPVMAQALSLASASTNGTAMSAHPAHCPHHAAASQVATQKPPADHGQGSCCGTSHCACAVSMVAVNDLGGLALPGIDHPTPPDQSPATARAFDNERLRPPDRLPYT